MKVKSFPRMIFGPFLAYICEVCQILYHVVVLFTFLHPVIVNCSIILYKHISGKIFSAQRYMLHVRSSFLRTFFIITILLVLLKK